MPRRHHGVNMSENPMAIQEALNRVVDLTWRYHETCARNFYRTDLTKLVAVGGTLGTDYFTVACAGHGLISKSGCGWQDTIERDPVSEATELTPRNACPRCNGSITVLLAEYGVGREPPEKYVAVPTPETRAEYERVGLEQHRLHVELYEARKHLNALIAA